MEENCPFCGEIEPRSRIIDETQNTLTILSNPSLVKGHCLVIPKKHVERLYQLDEIEREDLFSQIIKIEELLLNKFSGCDIRQNYRSFISQSKLKIDHLHFHLIPREFEDELYKKSQIFEKDIFKELNQEQLDKIKDLYLKMK